MKFASLLIVPSIATIDDHYCKVLTAIETSTCINGFCSYKDTTKISSFSCIESMIDKSSAIYAEHAAILRTLPILFQIFPETYSDNLKFPHDQTYDYYYHFLIFVPKEVRKAFFKQQYLVPIKSLSYEDWYFGFCHKTVKQAEILTEGTVPNDTVYSRIWVLRKSSPLPDDRFVKYCETFSRKFAKPLNKSSIWCTSETP